MLASAILSACVSPAEIPEITPRITLPASGDGYGVSTLSHKETRIPAAEWQQMQKRGIVLMSDDWAKLKYTLLKNCLVQECQQTVGALDGLFGAIDQALKQIPKITK